MLPLPRSSPEGVFRSVYADYLAYYQYRGEPRSRLRALLVPRLLTNPSMHATMLIRLALLSPRPLGFVWRNILISKHSIDVDRNSTIGGGLMLAHPFGIVLGGGVTIGTNVLLSHNVTLGAARTPRPGEQLPFPVIGDRVVIHPNTVVAGGIHIGEDSVIGANSFVDCDLPPGSVYRRGEIRTRR